MFETHRSVQQSVKFLLASVDTTCAVLETLLASNPTLHSETCRTLLVKVLADMPVLVAQTRVSAVHHTLTELGVRIESFVLHLEQQLEQQRHVLSIPEVAIAFIRKKIEIREMLPGNMTSKCM